MCYHSTKKSDLSVAKKSDLANPLTYILTFACISAAKSEDSGDKSDKE